MAELAAAHHTKRHVCTFSDKQKSQRKRKEKMKKKEKKEKTKKTAINLKGEDRHFCGSCAGLLQLF